MSGKWLEQAELERPPHRRTPVVHAELAVHGALVGLHGIERDIQPLADLTSRQPGGEQAKDPELLRGQLLVDRAPLVARNHRVARALPERREQSLRDPVWA